MHHSFDISIAEKYSVNVAIFLNNMAYWVKHNMANNRHHYDGIYWTYNSVRAYSTHFPYWSDKQVRTIIEHCISHGLIVKGNYNENKYDQTQWYGFTDLGHKLLNLTILPNGQMDSTEWANGFDQKGKPIPDNKPDIKPNKRERTEKRAPLSASFKPNEKIKSLFLETAERCGISPDDLQDKFFNIYSDPERLSTDWNKELHNFLIREKPSSKKKKRVESSESRSTVKEWGPGHPSWDAINGNKIKQKRDMTVQ